MKYSIRQLKSMARESLQGNYGTIISALLLYMLINFLINFVSNLLFRNGSTLTAVVSFLFSFVISLIMCIFSAGLDYMYLNISRKQPVQVSDLFYMFNHNPDRVIAAGFVLTLLTTLADLPITLSLLYLPGLSEGSPTALLQFMGIVLISIVLSVLLCFPFSFAYFLLAESPDMGAGEALKQSAGLIRHNFLRLFLLECSFLGLALLSVFTLYIALLFVIPYMRTSMVFLYREARGELHAGPHTQDNGPSFTQTSFRGYSQQDDYNSEA